MTTKGLNLRRAPVLLGTFKPPATAKDKTPSAIKIYSSVTQNVISGLKLKVEDNPEGKNGVEVRGTKGAGSVKIIKTTGSGASAKAKTYSIPVPGWFKIKDMREAVKRLDSKAETFTAPSGRVYAVGKATSSSK